MNELECVHTLTCRACGYPGYHRADASRMQRIMLRRGTSMALRLCVDTGLWHLKKEGND